MKTSRRPLLSCIAAGIGLTLIAGFVTLWDFATRGKDTPYDPNGW